MSVVAIGGAVISLREQILRLDRRPESEPEPLPLRDPGIVTVLNRDDIPSIDRPSFVTAAKAKIAPSALVIGYASGKDAHAYAKNLLNGHEIVNDTVDGRKIAVTW